MNYDIHGMIKINSNVDLGLPYFEVERVDPKGLAKGIEALIEDGELRKKIAENGYKFAQKLSWKRMTDEILQAVKNLVGD